MKYPMFHVELSLPLHAASRALAMIADIVEDDEWQHCRIDLTSDYEHRGDLTRPVFFFCVQLFFGQLQEFLSRLDDELEAADLDGSNLRVSTDDVELDDLVAPPMYFGYTGNSYLAKLEEEKSDEGENKKKIRCLYL